MSVVVNIRNAGALVDRDLGLDGVGSIAGALGFGQDIGAAVDGAVADRIRGALAADQVDAEVYVSASAPAAGGFSSFIVPALIALGVGFFIARSIK